MKEIKFEKLNDDMISVNGEIYYSVKYLSRSFGMKPGTIRAWAQREKPRIIRLGRLFINYEDFLGKYLGIQI